MRWLARILGDFRQDRSLRRPQHAADQQARMDALLLEAIDALASLLLSSHHPGNGTA